MDGSEPIDRLMFSIREHPLYFCYGSILHIVKIQFSILFVHSHMTVVFHHINSEINTLGEMGQIGIRFGNPCGQFMDCIAFNPVIECPCIGIAVA